MKYMAQILVFLVITSIAPGQIQSRLTRSTASEADNLRSIASMWEHYSTVIKSGDIGGLAALFTADAVMIEPGRPAIVGREAIRSVFEEAFKNFSVDEIRVTSAEIQISGEWAFEWGNYMEIVSSESTTTRIQVGGNYLAILAKVDGQPDSSPTPWKIARLMVNSTTPPSARGNN